MKRDTDIVNLASSSINNLISYDQLRETQNLKLHLQNVESNIHILEDNSFKVRNLFQSHELLVKDSLRNIYDSLFGNLHDMATSSLTSMDAERQTDILYSNQLSSLASYIVLKTRIRDFRQDVRALLDHEFDLTSIVDLDLLKTSSVPLTVFWPTLTIGSIFRQSTH